VGNHRVAFDQCTLFDIFRRRHPLVERTEIAVALIEQSAEAVDER
jgi:hypothetical protein